LTENLKPYAEYKDSEEKWLGNVPRHWPLLPNRALFKEAKDRNHPKEEMLSITITRGIIRQKALLANTAKKDSSNMDKAAYKLVQPGDIAYNKMRAWQGALGASRFRGIISPAYVVMRPRAGSTPWYYHHLYRTPSFAKEAERWSYGITSDMWSLRPEHFRMIYAVQPPPDEQATIVRFLEHANRKIDGFIQAKQKLIELLSEQKQAIIHRAVTRGLNRDVPLKCSGIPWLGDIPQHWEVWPLKRVGWFKSGAGFPVSAQGKKELEVPFLKVSDMNLPGNDVWMESSSNTVSRETAQKLGAFIFPADSIIFPKVGGAMLTNKRRLLKRPSCIDNNVMGCVVRRGHLGFIFLLLQQLDLGRLSKPGPVPAIGEGEVREIKVVFPPIDEQKAIVPIVEKETEPLSNAIARTKREIALMQEYRIRLNADIVTGKLDVREAAAELPELSSDSDSEPLSEETGEEIESEAVP